MINDIVLAIQDEQTQNAFLSNAIAERLDVTSNELEVLGTLVARGPLSAGDLAKRTGLTSGAVTRLIDRLVERGSVRRLADPEDRRRVLVEITPAALRACAPFYDPIAKEGTALLEQQTEKDLEVCTHTSVARPSSSRLRSTLHTIRTSHAPWLRDCQLASRSLKYKLAL